MRIITLSDDIQDRIDAIDAEVEEERVADQARLDAEYADQECRAAKQQQEYAAAHEKAARAAIVQQEILDSAYEEAVRIADERDREIESVREEAARALRSLAFPRALWFQLRALFMRRVPRPTRMVTPSTPRRVAPRPTSMVTQARRSPEQADDRRRLEDSRLGAQRLPGLLSQKLDDTWVLIEGYCNARGESDVVLVGPLGVCVIEVKYLNGLISVDGDSWWRDRYDSKGKFVGPTVPIRDRGGRSPSQQVREVASDLERFVQSRMHSPNLRVWTAVIFTHDRCNLGEVNASVDTVAMLGGLKIEDLVPGNANLSSRAVDDIVALIERDHDFHERRGAKAAS